MIINGEKLELALLADNDIKSLLKYFKLSSNRIAIELNKEILQKSEYDKVKLSTDDNIEIIHFVGGGN